MTSIIGGGFLATRGAHLLSDDKEPPLTAVGSSMTSNVVCPQIVLVKAEDETPCMMIDHTEATVISRSDAVLVPLKMEESGASLVLTSVGLVAYDVVEVDELGGMASPKTEDHSPLSLSAPASRDHCHQPYRIVSAGATLLQCLPSSSWVWATQHDECPRPSYKGK
jgi:hypothetical protein